MDFDFLSSNLQIAYPFHESVDVERASGVVSIDGLMAAMRVYTYDQREADLYVDEINVRSSDGFSTLDTAKITLRWSDDLTPFELENGVNAVAKSVVYGAWVVVRWRHTAEDFVVHIVFPLAVHQASSMTRFASGSKTMTSRCSPES